MIGLGDGTKLMGSRLNPVHILKLEWKELHVDPICLMRLHFWIHRSCLPMGEGVRQLSGALLHGH